MSLRRRRPDEWAWLADAVGLAGMLAAGLALAALIVILYHWSNGDL